MTVCQLSAFATTSVLLRMGVSLFNHDSRIVKAYHSCVFMVIVVRVLVETVLHFQKVIEEALEHKMNVSFLDTMLMEDGVCL